MQYRRGQGSMVCHEMNQAIDNIEGVANMLELLRSHSLHASGHLPDSAWLLGQHEILLGAVSALQGVVSTLEGIQTKSVGN